MPEKQRLGVLLLHGYAASLDTMRGLIPTLERLGLPYRLPVLCGHGTVPRDLRGVTWRDWYADAITSLGALLAEVERVAVVGLSLGALLAINLGIEHPTKLAGLVLAAPVLGYINPLARVARPLSHLLPYFPMPNSIRDPELAKRGTNYKWLESRSFSSVYEYSLLTAPRAAQLRLPLLLIQSWRDQISYPAASAAFVARVSTPRAQVMVHWLKRSGHEIMMDSEQQEVFDVIGHWLERIRSAD